MTDSYIYICIILMAAITFILRMISPVILRKPFKAKFLKSFVYYAPYVTLSVITVPAIFSCTGNLTSSLIGFAVSLITAFISGSMPITAAAGCLSVLIFNLF